MRPYTPPEPLWKRCCAAFGIRGVRLQIHVGGLFFPCGSEVTGQVDCQGGWVSETIQLLSLGLYGTQQTNGEAPFEKTMLAQNISLPANTTHSVPFSFLLPDRLPLHPGQMHLRAFADLRGSLAHPYSTHLVQITMHREVRAVVQALESAGFQEVSWFTRHLIRPGDNEGLSKAFAPPEHLADQLREVSVIIAVGGAAIWVRLTFHLVGDRLKALTGGNRIETQLTIPRADLMTKTGLPNSESALAYLNEAFASVLVLPENEAKWLLRASSAPPPSSDTLLRPAAPSESLSPEGLLRPSHPPTSDPPNT